MTAIQLKKKIDSKISMMSKEQLTLLEMYVDVLLMANSKNNLPPRNPKYGGRRISEDVANVFLTGNSLDVSDEELEQMKYEYLIEKYK